MRNLDPVTIPEFLTSTDLPLRTIAERLGVDLSQVYRWKDGDHLPSGVHLVGLYEMSGRSIDLSTVKKKKAPRKRTQP